MKLFTFFLFSTLVFAKTYQSHPPRVDNGYQFDVLNYQADNNGLDQICSNFQFQPLTSDPVVHYVEATDCVYDSSIGNYNCTDSQNMTSHYIVLAQPSFSSSLSRFYNDTDQFPYLRLYNVLNFSNPYSTCVSYSAPISIIAQSPAQLPNCDLITTDFKSADIYGSDHNIGYCACKPGYLPTPDPLVCESHDWSSIQDTPFTSISAIFASSTNNYNNTYMLYGVDSSNNQSTIDVPMGYHIYLYPSEDANVCNTRGIGYINNDNNLTSTVIYNSTNEKYDFGYFSSGTGSFDKINHVYIDVKDHYYFSGLCFVLTTVLRTGIYNDIPYTLNAPDNNTTDTGDTGTSSTGSDTGTGTGDTGSNTGTGDSGSTGTGDTGTTSGTGDTSTGTNDSSNTDFSQLHSDLLALQNTNQNGFDSVVSAENNTTNAIDRLINMNADNVESDTSYLDNFSSLYTDLTNSISNVETAVSDVKATISGGTVDFTMPVSSSCTIVFNVLGRTISFDLCQYGHIFRPYIVFILTVYFMIYLIRLHLFFFMRLFKNGGDE